MTGGLIADRYRLEEQLGRGAMAEVWRAEDVELERPVAIKLLAPDADRARFEREARAAAALAHSNLTQIYDYGEYEGRPFMVLEYLPGGTLEDRLLGQPLPDATTYEIAAGIAAGLAHAHERGLVHRDLKPANVLFDAEQRAKIADFGIAHLGGAGTLTEAGTVLGTAAYISPEQAAGETATPASDVYSLGVILFRMLTGRLPFEAEAPLELASLHRTAAPPPLSALRPDAPPRLEALVAAALAKDPRDRPRDGNVVLAELGEPTPTEETRVMLPAAAAPRPSRSRRLVPLGLALAVLGSAGAVAATLLATDSQNARAPTTAAHPATTHQRPASPPPIAASTRATTAPTAAARPTTTAARTTPAATPPPPPPPPSPPPPSPPPPPPPPPPPTTDTGVPVTLPSP